MNKIVKSESPDEYLKRVGIEAFDPSLVAKDPMPTLNLNKLPNFNQLKESQNSSDCNQCK
jgi:hypothetical protein